MISRYLLVFNIKIAIFQGKAIWFFNLSDINFAAQYIYIFFNTCMGYIRLIYTFCV